MGLMIPPGTALALEGPLGAGKTTFVRGLAEGIGCTDMVSSPTFTVVHTYRGGRETLHHVDLYRMAGVDEVEYLGLDDLFDGRAIVAIEWPQRAGDSLPIRPVSFGIAIPEPDRRTLTIPKLSWTEEAIRRWRDG